MPFYLTTQPQFPSSPNTTDLPGGCFDALLRHYPSHMYNHSMSLLPRVLLFTILHYLTFVRFIRRYGCVGLVCFASRLFPFTTVFTVGCYVAFPHRLTPRRFPHLPTGWLTVFLHNATVDLIVYPFPCSLVITAVCISPSHTPT